MGETRDERNCHCVIKSLPEEMLVESARVAARINPSNTREADHLQAASPEGVFPAVELAVLTRKYWGPQGVRLTVSFLDDSPAALREKILLHMNAWGRSANVVFVPVDSGGQVRITCTAGLGHWSYLGTDISLIPIDEATMNLDDFSMSTPESEFYRVVRHETGHTLGFPHEHQRADIVSRIDRARAIAHFTATYGWPPEKTIENVLTPLDYSALMSTARADPNSIMAYWLPGSIMQDGIAVLGGPDINSSDARFAGILYPQDRIPERYWGTGGDVVVARDYDGDGKVDLAIWRPGDGGWYILFSSTGYDPNRSLVKAYGTAGDIPVPADYDGDGRCDLAVWRPGDGGWYILYSSTGYDTNRSLVKAYGTAGDIPAPADYDGDGRCDLAVWRPSDGGWYILFSSKNYDTNQSLVKAYGTLGDVPVPADYDGDGKADLAVWRPADGGWYILFSTTGYDTGRSLVKQWGTAGDVPMPFDYDGDGKADLAIWRPSESKLYILFSSTGYDTALAETWPVGAEGQVVIPVDYDGDGQRELAIWRGSDGRWRIERLP